MGSMWRTVFNMLPDFSGILLAAVGVAFIVAPEFVSKLPTWLRWTLAVLLVVLGLAGLRSSYVQHQSDASDKDDLKHQLEGVSNQLQTLNSKVQSQFAPTAQPPKKQRISTAAATPKPSDVQPIQLSALFANPKSPTVMVENQSDRVADKITWEAVLYRESDMTLLSFATQDIGYVKAHSRGANYSIDLPNIQKLTIGGGSPQIAIGDVFTGSISFDCADCKGVTYIVHLIWGSSGWTYEVPNLGARLAVTKDQSFEGKQRWVQALTALAPPNARKPIVEQE